jgi:hypothetical protein
LLKPIPLQNPILLKGFWPTSNWKINHVRFSIPFVPIFDDIENPVILPYCGPKNMKVSLSTTTNTPFRDLHEKDFFLAHPSKPKMCPIWMGRTRRDVVKDANAKHYRMLHV